ncbi:phosphatase PAP2 family protein [Leucobacter muris]|uniref:Phosphatase PAP2 family protein n=1 Tax=Leucobacter muris TaxID=1935379 RepID=A0ABX5QDX7_9MICO|nr:phosphatase PAP2 family protein [Leucobacter muris]QAB17190.1 phosphatase PAP2 family protein [Leucobacter muris]
MSIPPRTASLARTATPWAVAGLVLIAALGAYLRLVHSGPFGVDEWWHGVAGATRGSAPHAVAVFMAEAGSGIGAAACTAIAAALLLALRRPRDAASVATAMVIGIAASETLKALVMRPRPWDPLFHAAGSSYPSGHSMGAAALAVSLALVAAESDRLSRSASGWAWALAAGWVVVMMWSRTALHVHWLSDTLAGALLGVCAAVLSRRLWERSAKPGSAPPPRLDA